METASIAMGPSSVLLRGLNTPPSMMTSRDESWAVVRAPTLWVTMRALRCGSTWASTWAAVVPEPRKTVSPGAIMEAAARAIRSFSAVCVRTLVT